MKLEKEQFKPFEQLKPLKLFKTQKNENSWQMAIEEFRNLRIMDRITG